MKTLRKRTSRHGEEKLMFSQEDSRANLSASQAKEREQMIIATSGRKCLELYQKSDPLGLLVKTLLASRRWWSPAKKLRWVRQAIYSKRITYTERKRDSRSKESAMISKPKDIQSNRCLFQLAVSEHLTEETESGLLPTVQTQGLKRCSKKGKTEFLPLDLFPTPTALDRGSGRINKSMSPGAADRPTLALAAKRGLLPTPMSTEITHSKRVRELKEAGGETFFSRKNGETRPNGLIDFLTFHNLLPSETGNKKTNGKTSQLNPLFVAEMMGFPSMWTALPFLSPSGGQNPSRPSAMLGCHK